MGGEQLHGNAVEAKRRLRERRSEMAQPPTLVLGATGGQGGAVTWNVDGGFAGDTQFEKLQRARTQSGTRIARNRCRQVHTGRGLSSAPSSEFGRPAS
jgi:hypothetical protein